MKTLKAICFECGAKKKSAIKMCRHCKAMPIGRREKVLSVCLSTACLTQSSMEVAYQHFIERALPPKFSPSVVRKAVRIVNGLPKDFQVPETFDISQYFSNEPLLSE